MELVASPRGFRKHIDIMFRPRVDRCGKAPCSAKEPVIRVGRLARHFYQKAHCVLPSGFESNSKSQVVCAARFEEIIRALPFVDMNLG